MGYKKKIKKEANKRYGGMSFGNDRNIFIEGAEYILSEIFKNKKYRKKK